MSSEPSESSDPSTEQSSEPADLALEVRHASKAYRGIAALSDVSFALRKGEAHALLGHNGAGKSTLARIIAGQVQPDEGEVRVDGEPVALTSPRRAQRHGIAVVDQELTLAPTLTVAENLELGSLDAGFLRRSRAGDGRVPDLLARLGLEHVSPDTPVGELTLAEQQLVEIARAVGRNAYVLVLDEPTATLGDREIKRVFEVVRTLLAEGRSVIYVSHRLGEVLDLCDRVTVLRDGRHRATRDVAGLDRRGIVALMLDDEHAEAAADRRPDAVAGAAVRLEVRGLSSPGRCAGVDLTVRAGEVVGIAGQIGSGGSAVLRALAGLDPDATGGLAVDGETVDRLGPPTGALARGIAFVSNDRKGEGLFLTKSVGRNLVSVRDKEVSTAGVVRPGRVRTNARSLAEAVGLAPRLAARVGALSGGNQQKVFIGRYLEHPRVRVLLLDEPTRGVDVAGRAEIHRLVRRAADDGAAVVFVSSELDEILDLADTVVTMFAGAVVATHARAGLRGRTVLAETTHEHDDTSRPTVGSPT